ncbi:MAG: GNAT family N-acetyltransferase [Bacteroidetes bacterium]|nr:GNAT family N-acetyltransferase [Bacteroidota bacterium]
MIKYKFVNISEFEIEIKYFFQKHPFGRYLLDRNYATVGAIDLEWNKLLEYSRNSLIGLALNNNSQVIGLIGFHLSKWDTDVFQKKLAFLQYFLVQECGDLDFEREVASNLLEKFHDWTVEYKIQVVISKLDTQYFSPIYILQQNGYIIYETLTHQTIDASIVNVGLADEIVYRYASDTDIEDLKDIGSKNTYSKSHFYLDNSFPIEKVNLMYACWMDNAVKSSQKIIIIEEDKQIAGVFVYDVVDYKNTIDKKFAVWKSAFVNSNFRDKGIGLKLFKAAMQSCLSRGVDVIDSAVVDRNIGSQNLHNKLGFRLVNTQYTFHKWFNNN